MAVSKSRKARMAAGFPGRRQSSIEKRMAAKRWVADKNLEPLTVMLDNMQDAHAEAQAKKNAKDKKRRQEYLQARARAQNAAVDAAPYVHQKLATTTLKGDQSAPVTVQFIDDIPD